MSCKNKDVLGDTIASPMLLIKSSDLKNFVLKDGVITELKLKRKYGNRTRKVIKL